MNIPRRYVRRASLGLLAAGVGVLALVALLVPFGGQGGDTIAPSDAGSLPIVTATAPVPLPTATPTVPGPPTFHVLARDDTVPEIDRFGVLFLDPETGGGELWDFSNGGGFVRSASRSYRYVAHEGPDGLMLLDTEDGSERLLEWEGKRLVPVELSPDGRSFVGIAGWTVAVFSIDTLVPTAYLDRPPRDFGQRQQPRGLAWSADSSSVAVALGDAGFTLRVVFRGRELALEGPVASTLQWSRDGTRLAAAGSGALAITIYDLVDGGQIEIPARGTNPRWSPDDAYLAASHPDNIDSVRVFDAATGEEVLRVTGSQYCAADYWYADGSIAGGSEPPHNSTLVPEGSAHGRLGGPPDATPIQFRGRAVGSNADVLVMLSVTGEQLAKLNKGAPALWSSPSDQNGAYRITDDGRGVMLVGVGESGICDAGGIAPGVGLPPFDSDDEPEG